MTHIHTKSLWLLIATLLLSVFGARAQDSGSEAPWTVNPHDYKYDMTLYANIVFDGTPITDFSHYEVGAFVGDECRGTAEVQTKDEAQWLYLRVRSNQPQGENIVLRLRDTDTGEVLNLQPESSDITFESQGLGGRPGSPLVLNAARSYSLTYIVGGEEYHAEEVPYGTTLTPIEYPEREGHSFSGWTGLPLTMPAHDVEVTGEFVINQYTITFDANGGSEVAPITQDYNTAITAPDAPTREGYTFMGWNEELPATMPARDLTLTAQWQINTYRLIYNVDGMTYTMVPVTYGDAVTPEPNPTKEGHTFSGWSEIPATMPASDVEVTGSFTVNTYKLVYKVDGEVYKTTEVTYGTAPATEPAPEKEGHTFSGWSEIPATMPASDVEVTGSFTVNTYKLVYKVDGEVYKTIEVTYGTAPATEAAPEKEGYTFSGWSEIPATMPASDVEVTGSFTVNTYKLVYKVDGEVYKTTEVTYGTAPATEPAPEKEGHTFSGWSEIPATMPANDVEVTGSFTVNTYKLVYKVDGEVYKTTEVTYGTAITPESAPEKEGHTFSGWSKIPATMPAHDVEVTGSFTANTYKLVYKVDGEVYKTTEVTYGTAITPEEAPTKEGYIFMGWSEIPATMPAHDVEVTGEFTKVTAIMQALGSTGRADVYSIEGRLIMRQATLSDVKALPNGLYLIGGRKVRIVR